MKKSKKKFNRNCNTYEDINQFDLEDENINKKDILKAIKNDQELNKYIHNSDNMQDILGIIQNQSYDIRKASKLFYRFLVIRQTILFLTIVTYFISLIQYFRLNILEVSSSFQIKFLFFTNFILKIMSTLLFILSRQYYDDYYHTSRQQKKDMVIYTSFYQQPFFYIKAILIFIHPLYFIQKIQVQITEYYFYMKDSEYIEFNRYVNDYFFIIQFTISFLVVFVISLELTRFYNYRTYRMCSFFRVNNDYFYVLKSVIYHYGVYFVAVLVFIGIFLFSGLIIVSERGFYIYKLNQIETTDRDQDLIEESKQLSSYFNAFWNMLITMTTIGYGDLYVKTQLARVIVFFCALYGLIIFPLLVVTITNMFKLSYEENASLNIMKLKYSKKEMMKPAIEFIISFFKYAKVKKLVQGHEEYYKKELKYFQDNMIVKSVNFKKANREYFNILGNDQNHHILRQTLILNKKFNTITKKLFPLVMDFKRTHNLPKRANSMKNIMNPSPQNFLKIKRDDEFDKMSVNKQIIFNLQSIKLNKIVNKKNINSYKIIQVKQFQFYDD